MTNNKFLFRVIIIIGIQVGLLPLCRAANSPHKIADCYKASKVYDWKKSTPSKQGMNPNILSKAFEEAHNKTYYFSLLVVRNGYLIAEEYYNGRDKYTMDKMYSVTKSFISALIGIAIQKGFIILQKYIPHDFEWRVVKIGDSYFGHQKIKQGDKASGTKGIDYTAPPLQLLDFARDISNKHQSRAV